MWIKVHNNETVWLTKDNMLFAMKKSIYLLYKSFNKLDRFSVMWIKVHNYETVWLTKENMLFPFPMISIDLLYKTFTAAMTSVQT